MKRATEDTLGNLHGLIAEKLIEKIKDGKATTADFNTAIKFLKDNNIEAGEDNEGLSTLKDILPDLDETQENVVPLQRP